MDPSIGSAREWYYRDENSGSQRGPVPATLLCKLLEKGIGVNGSTVVWKQGMDAWLPMSSVSSLFWLWNCCLIVYAGTSVSEYHRIQ